jgi:molybdate transport system substrate-binding protein
MPSTGRLVALLAVLALAGAAIAAALATRGPAGPGAPPAPVVLAASSLTDVLPAIDGRARYSFAGSNTLARQVERGAAADVIVSADAAITGRLFRHGLVERPVAFARNRLVVIVPRSNPAHVRSVADLARRGTSVDVADPAVPVGAYTLRALHRLHLAARVELNVVSRETDVRAVLSKIVIGQADAGVVYATDARSVGVLVRAIPVPARAQPSAVYTAAVVVAGPHRDEARAYVRSLAMPHAQRELRTAGFLTYAPLSA